MFIQTLLSSTLNANFCVVSVYIKSLYMAVFLMLAGKYCHERRFFCMYVRCQRVCLNNALLETVGGKLAAVWKALWS